jgi:molybdopterin converting factor small subunit
MKPSPEEFFKDFASKIELIKEERQRISKKHLTLRERLKEELTVEEDFLTGSYNRNTIIRPKKESEKFDVDFFLAFNKEEYGEKELPELLDEVKAVLEEIKEEDNEIEEIIPQKRSIGVIYKDNFQIDVVPAIQIEKDKKYKIFDKRSQKAVLSNPKLHGENLTTANESTESGGIKRLVPIVKLLKSWKREKCSYIKSFHLELLIVEILGKSEINSFSQGIHDFFLNAEEYLCQACMKDPANKENLIDAYLDEDKERDNILNLVKEEKEKAKKALELENDDEKEKAVEEWEKIFSKKQKKNFEPVIINTPPPKQWSF